MPCDRPLLIPQGEYGREIPVPCGRCAPCKIRRVNEWVFRLMWEEEHNSTSSHFVTLTYNTHYVPITPHGFMTLKKEDYQNYMKRLRLLCEGSTLKYYACGEYGSKNQRPHYHAIIFNCPNPDFFADAWTVLGDAIGDVHVGTCTTDSVAYCMKYIDKESFRSRRRNEWRHSRDDRINEFALMSKGLGAGYVSQPGIKEYHNADLNRNYLTKLSGHKVALPRYYRKQIYSVDALEEQRYLIEEILSENAAKERTFYDDRPKLLDYDTYKKHEREGRERRFIENSKKRNTL